MTNLNKNDTSMRYNNLGRTGLLVSELSFGCMMLQRDERNAYDIMKCAYEGGINMFDNAEGYGHEGYAEVVMGNAIHKGIKEGLWEREDLVITTKIFFGGRGQRDTVNSAQTTNRKKLYEGLKSSLARMRLDYVDLVFCHRCDTSTPMEETVRGMNHLIDRGMAYYWGTSEWTAQQLQEATLIAENLGLVGPKFDQLQYNLFHRERLEREYQPLYKSIGLGTTIWSPLAGGLLSGKISGKRTTEKGMARLKASIDPALRARAEAPEKLLPIAQSLSCTLAQLALAWCASNKNVSTVICGASSVNQMKENLAAVEVIQHINDEIRHKMDKALGESLNTMYIVGKRSYSLAEYNESINSPPSPTSARPLAREQARL